MFKKFLFLFFIIFLSNCSAPGTAFLGPVFTGAKTGSISQATLSYSSGQIFEQFQSKQAILNKRKKSNRIVRKNPILPDISYNTQNPTIILSYKVDKVEEGNVYEPEPLP